MVLNTDFSTESMLLSLQEFIDISVVISLEYINLFY